jgi:hypothetical protein
MARGWESKSIEEQQSAFRAEGKHARPALTVEQAEQKRRRDGLELSRKRVLAQRAAAVQPKLQKMLDETLLELDRRIAILPEP